MSWLGLDPSSIARRAQSAGGSLHLPTLPESALRGAIGFALASAAGFSPWALAGGWFHRTTGELGMYLACLLVFLIVSGLPLHPLIIGPGSLSRFYALFSLGYSLYAAAWIAGWMGLHGHVGSLTGLAAGSLLFGLVLASAFSAYRELPRISLLLFVLNTAGYYAGGWVEGKVAGLQHLSLKGLVLEKAPPTALAMLLWGVSYGLGMGAGLGLAFYFCQARARRELARESPTD